MHKEVYRLIRGDGCVCRLVDVLVNYVLELTTKHRAGHQELFLVHIGEVRAQRPLANHWDAIRILCKDPLGLRTSLLEWHRLLECAGRHCNPQSSVFVHAETANLELRRKDKRTDSISLT